VNTYWGGAVSGIAGCLVFGALPRLRSAPRTRDAILLGIGLGLQLLTRPFEFIILAAVVILFFVPVRSLIVAGLVLLPAVGLTLLQNHQVTGRWMTLPYELSRYQYGVPATFTVQANPIPHRALTAEQQVDYDAQVAVHGNGDSIGRYLRRLATRVRFQRFFFLAPLYLAMPAFLFAVKEYRFKWVLLALALFSVADAFYPYFYPHYIAAATCLFLLVAVKSLELLSRWKIGRDSAALIVILCLAHFAFWYGVHLNGNESMLSSLNGEESWDTVNYGDPEGRIAIQRQLAAAPGRQLVFVHFSPRHGAQEWIHNDADIDRARVVWAIDLGPAEDTALRRYYPDRTAWLMEGDAHPPVLRPYPIP
jgi:4-amino-4-deoxy-L-arabinose transferase-like glycosyltransferase